MCHADTPAGAPVPGVQIEAVVVPLANGERLPATLARREAGGGPAVLLVHDIFGASAFYQGVAARLAGEGYQVLLPNMFHREGELETVTRETAYARWRRFDERRALGELHEALDWLAAHGRTAGGRLGTIGFCLCGTLVLDLTATRRDLATVCFYGFPAAGAHSHPWSVPPPLELVYALSGPILGFWGDQDVPVGFANVLRLREALEARQAD